MKWIGIWCKGFAGWRSRAYLALADQLLEAHLREDPHRGDVGRFMEKVKMSQDFSDRAIFDICRNHLRLTVAIGIALQIVGKDVPVTGPFQSLAGNFESSFTRIRLR